MLGESPRRLPFPSTARTALALVSAGAAVSLGGAYGCSRHAADTRAELPHRAGDGATPPPIHDDRLGLQRVAEQAMPAVVSVASTHAAAEPTTPDLPFDDPFFQHFFGPHPPFSPSPRGPMPERRGLGSGVIVGGNVILTNAHVVEGAKELIVTAQNRRNLEVELAGVDPKSDLAVLRIKGDTKGLSSLEFADSDKVHLGQLVLAIGNPFGVGETVTMGIVSARGRADLGIADYEDFIQTDAAINPGNSGGALVDLDGHLLGIPAAILSRSGGYMGVGFAIPSNMARPIMESLLATGHVARSYLGVAIQDVDRDLAKALGLQNAEGVLISDVVAGGPSDKAGLKRGDVVLSIDGKVMSSTGQLRNTVATAGVGKQIQLEISRQGAKRAVTVTLAAMPEDKPQTPANGGPSIKEPGPLGTTLAPLDAAVRRQLDVPSSIKTGVVVTNVEPNSKASEAGLRSGDVIVELNGTAVTGADQLNDLWKKSTGTVAVLLFREGRTRYVAVKH